jgi:predicted O-methyltransferase YrrM
MKVSTLFYKHIRRLRTSLKKAIGNKTSVSQFVFSRTQRREWQRMKLIGFRNLWRIRRRQSIKHVVVDAPVQTYIEQLIAKRFNVGTLALHSASVALPQSYLQIDTTEAGFLKCMVNLIGAHQVLEVGTFRGWSTAVIAEALIANELEGGVVFRHNQYVYTQLFPTTSIPLPVVTTIELRPEEAVEATSLWDAYLDPVTKSRIRLIQGSADEVMKGLVETYPNGLYNMIFIDADKSRYEIYLRYAQRLLLPGGIIVIDNILNAGLVATSARDRTTEALRLLNTRVFEDVQADFEPMILPAWDGVIVIRRKYTQK